MHLGVLCSLGQNFVFDPINLLNNKKNSPRSSSPEQTNSTKFAKLCRILQYEFQTPELLERALTHRSKNEAYNNDTLEFLGDSVLGFVISDMLYRTYSSSPEGELTLRRSKIINNNDALRVVAQKTQLMDFIQVGHSFPKSNDAACLRLQVNALEAIIGAIYLDGGLKSVKKFISIHFHQVIKNHEKNLVKDYKTLLQESLQKEHQVYPEYHLVSTEGPPHLPNFVVECCIEIYDMRTTGEGQSVKAAEQNAAMKAYNAIVENG